jgi:hypothetical protein
MRGKHEGRWQVRWRPWLVALTTLFAAIVFAGWGQMQVVRPPYLAPQPAEAKPADPSLPVDGGPTPVPVDPPSTVPTAGTQDAVGAAPGVRHAASRSTGAVLVRVAGEGDVSTGHDGTGAVAEPKLGEPEGGNSEGRPPTTTVPPTTTLPSAPQPSDHTPGCDPQPEHGNDEEGHRQCTSSPSMNPTLPRQASTSAQERVDASSQSSPVIVIGTPAPTI